ncbi:MAG TPA: T9SS type A sorting domain-containing protein, partial [Cytophagales bacterium]
GDGTPFSNSNAPSHTYSAAGTYTARLRVMDNRNLYSAPVSRTITVSGSTSTGSLLASENFNATAGTLHNVNTGTGWGAAWQVQNGDVSVPGYNVTGTASLAYSTLATSGKYAVGGDSYQTSGRALNTASTGPFSAYLIGGNIGATGKTLWVSALLRKDAANDEEVSLTLHAGTIVMYPNPALVSVGYFGTASNNGTTRYWSLKVGSTVYRTATAITTGQAALLVLKLDFAATSTASLFVNPASLGGTAPTTAGASGTSTTSLAFKSLAFYGGNGFNQGATDEIRFGETYASVTPTGSARIGTETAAGGVQVFPNPVAGGTLHVKVYARQAGTAQVALAGTQGGRTLLKDFAVQRGENLLQLGTGTLPGGLYLLSVQQGGQRTVQKVVITR